MSGKAFDNISSDINADVMESQSLRIEGDNFQWLTKNKGS